MSRKRLVGFTDEEFEELANPINKRLISEFLEQSHLADQTLKQYKSALYIFSKWIYEKNDNEPITSLMPRDGLRFQNFLINSGLSSSAVKARRYAVSSLCGFIEVYYGDKYPNFRNIYSRAIPNVPDVKIKDKEPLSMDEIETLIKALEEKEDWQKIAYILFTYSTGCRREESRQLLTEVAEYDKVVDSKGNVKNYYATHQIRAKGRGREGNLRRFTFDERAMKAIQKWIEYRKDNVEVDDCPYVFVSKRNGKYQQLSANTFNLWCDGFSKILGGRPVHPHLFRSSRATNSFIEEGKSIEAIQKLLGHASVETTQIYIVRDESEDLDELYE